MSEMIQAGFDYGALPSETAIVARTAAERIRLRLKRTVEDIIEIGRELIDVKDELPHGQFEIWIRDEFQMNREMANNFMQVATRFGGGMSDYLTFKPTVLYALAAPSTPDSVIEKATERVEAGEKVTIADVKQWKEAAQVASQRAEEFKVESNERRKKIRELETTVGQLQTELDIAKTVLENQPEKERIVTPADYEATKQKASLLAGELDNLKKHQASIVQSQVTAKLKERERELAELDSKIKGAEAVLKGLQEGLDRYSNKQRELQVHLDAIEKARVAMAMLAANMEGFEAVIDHDNELRLWRALSQMLRNGAEAIDYFIGDAKPRLAT